ncbi:hypothetical protein CDAR_76191 [Caerostris darwini]|uniref:Ycf15 n=1 Tax=Caerostris darwini TaxID=1538125 RepID=A0AAV4PX95_9ARAC|nr:hypothetical protein CDAR_76191 [Caerostris darwini]
MIRFHSIFTLHNNHFDDLGYECHKRSLIIPLPNSAVLRLCNCDHFVIYIKDYEKKEKQKMGKREREERKFHLFLNIRMQSSHILWRCLSASTSDILPSIFPSVPWEFARKG